MAMMPTFNTRPVTDLQRLLHDKGFIQWYTFPGEGGFYAALGFCMLLHIYPNYTEFPVYVQKTFKTGIARLIEIEDLYEEDVRYSKAEYWKEIGIRCNELCQSVFSQKEHVNLRICSWKMLDPNEKDLYDSLADHFKISLALHQWTDGNPITSHFVKGIANQNRFFVNLAYENGQVSALIHKDMEWGSVPRARFPYYMKIGSREAEPLILTPKSLAQNVQHDPRETLIRSLISMNKALAQIIIAGLTEVPSSQGEAHELLTNLYKEAAQILASTVPGCTMDSEELIRVLELPIAQVRTRPEHTLRTCGEYPELGELIPCHDHKFHRFCLRNYIAEQQTINLGCPSCPLTLPGVLLDQFPDLKEYLNQKRREVLNSATTSSVMEMCTGCRAKASQEDMCQLSHSCKLCKTCCAKSWEQRSCVRCQILLSNDDYQKMSDFFRSPKATSGSTTLPTG